LFLDGPVSVLSAPAVDATQAPTQVVLGRLGLDDPVASPGPPPVEGEPEQVEGLRLGPGALDVPRRALEPDQPGLFRMQFQSIPLETLGKHLKDPLSVFPVLEEQHSIVSVPDQLSRTAQPWLGLRLKPLIQYLMEEDIGEQRRYSAGNKGANFGLRWGLRIARGCLQPGVVGCPEVAVSLVFDAATSTHGEPQS